ncbi:glutamate receptor ionotropic, delta-1-like [Mytilus trossulus]|uniref:glutamate receptor ionotropic, delta-1-like n=1 Tax=Mytilus trossulus TaxID=6551 RepID=UPI0030079B8D
MKYFTKCNWTRGGGVLTDKLQCPKPYGQFIYKEHCLVCTTDTIANRVVHSNNTFRSFIKQEPLSYITSTAMLTMLSLIVHLKWSSVCVIFDNETKQEAIELHEGLSAIHVYAVMYSMEEVTSSKIDDLLATSSLHESKKLNFTVLCRLESCQSFLKKPFDYGRRNVWRSALLHFSRWLVAVFHSGTLTALETNNSCPFDNVAVLQFPTIQMHNSQIQSKFGNRLNSSCDWMPVLTLMWRTERREFSTVGYVNGNGTLLAEKEIFPNAKFGFNMRKLEARTLPWPPFVKFDNKTKQYSGISIELVKQLADGLNFTYDIKEPPDGHWGIPLDDGSWTGMVGQLQRREIDFVAAPLTVQAQREMVIDFTHPYHHETAVILMKTPDENASQWTRLLDPLSPMVFLCIGIALLITSFFIFILEKYNPFYSGDNKERWTKRGLHHFCDAFCYMYGALLCQGSGHVAASSTGRTFLSSWWLFCIVVAATYSGNFVAFLTYQKVALPFKDINGLIAQNTYTWGTTGGTVYETLFQTSEVPAVKEVWNGIVRFSKDDPSVLDHDTQAHIQKVKGGNYAYFGDRTLVELSMASSCDLVLASTDIFYFTYALGLPNHSPFEKIFSDEVISILESGLLQVWKLKLWPKPGNCEGISATEAKSIGVIDIQISFHLISFGIGIAALTLFIERVKFWCIKTFAKRVRKGATNDNEENNMKTIEDDDVYSTINQVSRCRVTLHQENR